VTFHLQYSHAGIKGLLDLLENHWGAAAARCPAEDAKKRASGEGRNDESTYRYVVVPLITLERPLL
jgi:hypothetical protein